NYFNVFAIKCVSTQSGVTHPGTATDVAEPASPVMTVTNMFDTQFDNFNIHRLIYSNDQAAVYSVLGNYFPAYDQVVILGNSTEY
ncbi:M64 family metallopeptidase, partial [Salmonella enterica subsp. enterica serovar Typhimurium]|nr:M64 family metallopeptidase [Salmonella enterica subsp. enterica serovar Typhimurium]